jgi:hypothetical protein
MDLHVIGPWRPRPNGRRRRRPGPARVRLGRRVARFRDGWPRRSRRSRHPCEAVTAAPGAPRHPVEDRLDQPAGAQLRVPPARGGTSRGLRGRHVLRPSPPSRAHRLSPTSVTTSRAPGWRRDDLQRPRTCPDRPGARQQTDARPGCAARAWASAIGRQPRCSPSPGNGPTRPPWRRSTPVASWPRSSRRRGQSARIAKRAQIAQGDRRRASACSEAAVGRVGIVDPASLTTIAQAVVRRARTRLAMRRP